MHFYDGNNLHSSLKLDDILAIILVMFKIIENCHLTPHHSPKRLFWEYFKNVGP